MRSLNLKVGGEAVEIDLSICGPQAELIAKLQEKDDPQLRKRLDEIPGGAPLLRSFIAFCRALGEASGEQAVICLQSPPLRAETLPEYIQAGVVLGSPQLLQALASSAVCQELSSRRAVPLLEEVVSCTSEQGADNEGRCRLPRPESSEMQKAISVVISAVCARLDPRDFRLGASLAHGSAYASLEVLQAHRRKYEEGLPALDTETTRNSTIAASVTGSMVSTMGSSFTGSFKMVDDWTEHQFALHVIRYHLERGTELAIAAGDARRPPPLPDEALPGAEKDSEPTEKDLSREESGEEFNSFFDTDSPENDISEEICDAAPDSVLEQIAGVVEFLDSSMTPPVLAAVLVRALLLVRKEDRADALFQAVFARSGKLQEMVVTRQVPVSFLRGVRRQRLASITLRKILATYESMDRDDLCALIEDLLFDELLDEEHCHKAIVQHVLMRNLILWMRSGGVAGGARRGNLLFDPQASRAERLRQVGERLFAVAFVAQHGFLPSPFIEQCPWDSGALDLQILTHASATEDALQLARRVLLRCLQRDTAKGKGGDPEDSSGTKPIIKDAGTIAGLWPLGRWSLCRDVGLISEAFYFLSACWRAVVGLPGLGDISDSLSEEIIAGGYRFGDIDGAALVGAGSRRLAEELLFKMFTDLEIWRLPHKDLLIPWLPGQILSCHIAAQCQQLEERQVSLVEETLENLEEIARLNMTISQLNQRLEATDARSQQCMQKQADLNDHLRQLR